MTASKRADRRRRTLRIALRRRRRDLRDFLSLGALLGTALTPAYPERSSFYFAKNYRRHRCGKRRPGRPKVGYGVCHCGLRESVRARILSRRLCRDLTAERLDPGEY